MYILALVRVIFKKGLKKISTYTKYIIICYIKISGCGSGFARRRLLTPENCIRYKTLNFFCNTNTLLECIVHISFRKAMTVKTILKSVGLFIRSMRGNRQT